MNNNIKYYQLLLELIYNEVNMIWICGEKSEDPTFANVQRKWVQGTTV